MGRKLFNLASAVSLLLCCAVVLSWLTSLRRRHGVVVTGWHQYALVADRGRLEARHAVRTDVAYAADGTSSVHEASFRGGAAGAEVRWHAPEPMMAVPSPWRRPWLRTGVAFSGGEVPIVARSGATVHHVGYQQVGERTTAASLPHWMAALACAGPAALWGAGAYRRRARAPSGRCPACGYDLRATPDRCPECGTAAEPAAA